MDKSVLTDYLDSLEKLGIPGCECFVYRNHKPVVRYIGGYSDAQKTIPLTSSSTFWLYSVSKISTITAVMQLIEKGKIGLDDPVSNYLPEYGNLSVKHGSTVTKAKNTMTIRHLLSMQSGLNYDIKAKSILKVIEDTNGTADTRDIIRALANEPLDFEPGTHFQYSLSHDVLGAVIEVVSNQKFGDYLYDNIFKPLGMKNTGFEMTPERKAQLSGQFEFHADTMTSTPVSSNNTDELTKNYQSGGGGLISTADDYILLLDAICNGGTGFNGYKLLDVGSINMIRTDQLNSSSKKDFELFQKPGYSYGLGVRTLIEKENSGAKSPLGEFGWDGSGGAYTLMDVDNRLAIFYVQHVLECDYAFKVIHKSIRDIVYDTLLK